MSQPTTKEARSIQVKVLVPYAIIAVMVISMAGLVTGWNLRSADNARVHSEAKSMLQLSKEQ